MIAGKVLSEKELQGKIKKLGFSATTKKTETGKFWKNKDGKYILVPFADEGLYPDWMLVDLESHVGRLRFQYEKN